MKISYIYDKSGKINKTKEINLKFNIDKTNIYIGCDKKNNFEGESNAFFGYIGTVIFLDNKKLSKKGEEISDLILQLNGDYASIILGALKENDSKILTNFDRNCHFMNSSYYNEILNILNEILVQLE